MININALGKLSIKQDFFVLHLRVSILGCGRSPLWYLQVMRKIRVSVFILHPDTLHRQETHHGEEPLVRTSADPGFQVCLSQSPG